MSESTPARTGGRSTSEVVFQADGDRLVPDATELQVGIDGVTPSAWTGAWLRIRFQVVSWVTSSNLSPARRHPHRRARAQRVVDTGQHLVSEDGRGGLRIENAGCAGGRAFGGGRPVRIECDQQILGFRLANPLTA